MIQITIFSLFCLISGIIIFTLGIVVFIHNRKSTINQVFLVLCLAAAYFAFTEFMLSQSESLGSATLWLKLTAFWTFIPALMFHFVGIFTRNKFLQKNAWIYVLVYISAAFFCCIELFTNLITTEPVLEYWGYTFGYSENAWPLFIEVVIWDFGLVLCLVILLLRFYYQKNTVQEKLQAKYIAIGIGIPAFTDYIVAMLGRFFPINLPDMQVILLPVFCGFVGYAIWRSELFLVSPATAADNILSTMSDSVILLNTQEEIVVVNNATRVMLGNKNDLIGHPFSFLFFEGSDKDIFLAKISQNRYISDYETSFRADNGKIVPVSLSGSGLKDKAGNPAGVVCVARDITERTRMQSEIETSLREKEMLIKEIHHRVKNNMQVVSSLLLLQRKQIADPKIRELFKESESRIFSIALVHEKLYQAKSLSVVDYQQYLIKLSDNIFYSQEIQPGRIRLEICAEGIFLPIEKAIPLSLITNELLTNSLKYAFPDDREGTITIAIDTIDHNSVRYLYRDDGVGFPEGLDHTRTESLGMQLVHGLVDQLNGTLTLTRGVGTTFAIVFAIPLDNKRDRT